MIRTRIAPSPTGYPHIGTMYQALFDYAFAKKHGGHFLIRIEDTDRARFVEGAEEKIFEAVDWFGLTENESARKGGPNGPYRQSERLAIYKKYADELVAGGHAYHCFCTKERLDEVRAKQQAEKKIPMYDRHCRALSGEEVSTRIEAGEPHVVRIKIPDDEKIVVNDLIRGEISFDSHIIQDQVLLKSDGYPTYHLAVVVDDHLMEVSHVVRGEEWISTSPIHILLYRYFNWTPPVFFHTPLLRNPDKSKLSKRHGHTNVVWYQEQGYLPQAIVNYLALMGWSHPEGKEIFSMDEFISTFDLSDVKAVGPTFDLKKLDWMNGEYIRTMSDDELTQRIDSFSHHAYPVETLKLTVPLIKERIKKLSEYDSYASFFYRAPETYEMEMTPHRELIGKMAEGVESVGEWNAQEIGEAMAGVAAREGVKNSLFFMVLRVAVSGRKVTPPLNESMEILGKEEVYARLKKLSL